MRFFNIYGEDAVQLGGAQAQTQVAGDAGTAEPAGGGLFGGGPMMLIIWGVVIVGMWFLLIRPQRKREKEVREMQSSLKVGDNIVTTSGFFGKIVGSGADAFLIEFGENKSLRVWVRKGDIAGNKTPTTTPDRGETPAVEDKKKDKEDKKDNNKDEK
ncbi:MAG: preprotein translocase subunit YajC [Defluviitaleaceae bacterium]|nr:preprotein translocase subunit YajC [Defluviitaleaceae bacterium]